MAQFQKKKIDIDSINGGNRYQVGDTPTPETFNAPIEASAYAQEIAEDALDNSNVALTKADQALSKVNESEIGEISLSAYPVGSIYLSVSSVSPASLFGGDWLPIENAFLLASGDKVGRTTGGTSTVMLKNENLPANMGTFSALNWLGNANESGIMSKEQLLFDRTMSSGVEVGTTVYTLSGGGKAIDIMPPYLVVYMWERIG